ncbi:MAG: DNA repair protein RadA [bacterium]
MSKAKLQYVCQTCGHASPKWLGRCPSCGEWNTFVEEAVTPAISGPARATSAATPVAITEVETGAEPRTSTGIGEFDRVLGGGLVAGSLVLVGGEPGAGKSTLLLQACQHLAAEQRVVYVSGEESAAQIKLRAQRLGVTTASLMLLAENDLQAIIASIESIHPSAVVVDSIQTVYTSDVASAPGSVAQVRECAAALMRLAKGQDVTVLIVGHVTKEGQLAGPRVLEHIVDTVLYFEGDQHHAYRVLRATKNRFGSTNEIGVFEMHGDGLREVANPSAAFLSERASDASGSAVVCALEGTRPVLLEVQALVTPTVFGMPRRTAAGLDYNRMVLMLAVLEKRAGLHLSSHDVYASVAGGVNVDEPAIDLGLAAAVASSLRDRPVDAQTVAIGEIGLSGEVRAVPQLPRRAAEAARLGFRRVVVPRTSEAPAIEGVEVIQVQQIAQALATLIP